MERHTLKISSAAVLQDLARDYAIFTHGAFFVYGRLDVDPVADYILKHADPDVMAMPVTFTQRLFHGLAAPGKPVGPPCHWEYTLFFIEHRYWADLRQQLCCCGWVDRRRKFYGRAVMQTIPIIDFLVLEKALIVPAPLPTVEITVFGVDGTNVHVQFMPRVGKPGDVPIATHRPLVAETQTLGAALLSCQDRPFHFIEPEDPYARHQDPVPPPAGL
jgi:hypothetical protein